MSLQQFKHIHIVGVCGTLMGAFASFLKRAGIEITGSDENVYPPMSDVLERAGVRLLRGYSASNLTALGQAPDLTVIGNVIRRDNPEAAAIMSQGLPYTSLPEFMEKFLLPKTLNILASGTHGKTTTSSMLAHVLSELKLNPSYFIGGVSQNLPHSFHVAEGDSKYFVLEGDEYDTAFWDKVPKFNHYLPDHVILTSVEYDHADIYPNFESVLKAFDGLVSRIRKGGSLIACLDYPEMPRFIEQAKSRGIRIVTYGTQPGADFYPKNIRVKGDLTHFEVHQNTKGLVVELSVGLPGNHNVLNALAAWIECQSLGVSNPAFQKALSTFNGVKRRQEVRAEVNGITVIDDFAHHPTAVRETLRALKLKYPGRRVVAVFEPRSATSRRKVFQKDYVDALAESQLVILARPYDQSRIDESDRFSIEELVGDLRKRGTTTETFLETDEGVLIAKKLAQKGDVMTIMSNGGFGGFIPKLIEKLKSSE